MYKVLQDLHVVEGASFVAAPSCGLYLAQLGAEVIRFDNVGGGLDYGRWPRSPGGHSLYWEGLNKGKKSIAIDLRRPEGRELAVSLVTAPGRGRGIFLTNFPAKGFLAYDRLTDRRPDLIVLRVMGRPGGETALDYTVNCAVGIPQMTGPASLGDEPVNHVLPAWDLTTGAYAAFALLAADRHRQATGKGQEVRLSLSDVAMSTIANMGQVAETEIAHMDRPRYGNDLYGAFGRDFVTRDGKRIMLVGITPRQWSSLVAVLDLATPVAALEARLGVSFAVDEGVRFDHREDLNRLVEQAVGARDYAELVGSFDAVGLCWGPYRTLREALDQDPDFSVRNPMFSMVEHPSGSAYLTPGAAATFAGLDRLGAAAAPRLGEHTDEILATYLGLSGQQIGHLHDSRLVEGPAPRG